MAENRIAGTCFVSADGVRLSLVGEFTYRPSGVMRETKMGADGFHGHKEKPIQGQIKAKLRDTSALSVSALNRMVDISVVAELANGKTIIGRNMAQVGEPPMADAEESEIEITWEGPDVREG